MKDLKTGLLLIGPTGVGKTPLGAALEECGLWGYRCVHFDFGACLRAVDSSAASLRHLTGDQKAVVRRVLSTNALLSDAEFGVAIAVWNWFCSEKEVGEGSLVVLNGLPRHVGQAKRMKDVVNLKLVLQLECTAPVICERIRRNVGRDRAGRIDDSAGEIANKLRIFEERTRPLIDYYLDDGVRVEVVNAGVDTTADELVDKMEGFCCGD